MACDSDPGWRDRSGRAIAGCATRDDRGRDLGGCVFVAWRARLINRRDALFHRFDDHTRCLGAGCATALADDGRAGGGRWHATVRYQHGLHFRGDAVVLADAIRVLYPPSLTARAIADVADAARLLNFISARNTPVCLPLRAGIVQVTQALLGSRSVCTKAFLT
jgi:hypothetical protein